MTNAGSLQRALSRALCPPYARREIYLLVLHVIIGRRGYGYCLPQPPKYYSVYDAESMRASRSGDVAAIVCLARKRVSNQKHTARRSSYISIGDVAVGRPGVAQMLCQNADRGSDDSWGDYDRADEDGVGEKEDRYSVSGHQNRFYGEPV